MSTQHQQEREFLVRGSLKQLEALIDDWERTQSKVYVFGPPQSEMDTAHWRWAFQARRLGDVFAGQAAYLDGMELPDERMQLKFSQGDMPDHRLFEDTVNALLSEMGRLRFIAEPEHERPSEPQKPNHPAKLDVWFEYHRKMADAGRKYTLKQLAADSGYSHGYVRQEHRIWLSRLDEKA